MIAMTTNSSIKVNPRFVCGLFHFRMQSFVIIIDQPQRIARFLQKLCECPWLAPRIFSRTTIVSSRRLPAARASESRPETSKTSPVAVTVGPWTGTEAEWVESAILNEVLLSFASIPIVGRVGGHVERISPAIAVDPCVDI